ncbi:MAG: hypothetical protein KBD01_16405 [Acidobacteria bacterium]|nr:hypothetical protein [Acidobacteriota bacterium]
MLRQCVTGFTVLACALGVLALAETADRNAAEIDKLEARSVPMIIKAPDTTLVDLFETVATSGGFDITYVGEAPAQRFAFEAKDMTIGDVLLRLAREHSLAYRVPDPRRLEVTFGP